MAGEHASEELRLTRLQSIGILDTPREQRFERIVFMAAQIAKVPIAKLNFIDKDRLWSKAYVGTMRRECSREDAFCSHTILEDDGLIVEDMRADLRFSGNPFVTGEPFIRFYAGFPLLSSDGLPVGTLCVVDRQPRRLTQEQIRALKTLVREAEAMLQPLELDIAV
jgi:GAF domain-containing protein